MSRLRLLLVWCAVVPFAAPPAASAAGAGWTRPVGGPVVAGFSYTRERAFAAGARRGVDLAAASGAPVRAPCSGRVTYSGAVPGWSLGVTVRCGRRVATLLRLGAIAVRRGAGVLAGQRVGAAGASRVVRLGARLAGDRFGYVDPMGLMGGGARVRVPLFAPPPRASRPPPAPRAWRGPAAPSVGARAPLAAWAGAALLACALGAGGSARAVRRRRRAALAASRSAQASAPG